MLRFIAIVERRPVPDVVRTLLYRKAFFGRWQSDLTQRVMRGPSEWTVGSGKLFAAFVSRLNHASERALTPRSRRWPWAI